LAWATAKLMGCLQASGWRMARLRRAERLATAKAVKLKLEIAKPSWAWWAEA
jgi:hypothetical protein